MTYCFEAGPASRLQIRAQMIAVLVARPFRTTQRGPITQRHRLNEPTFAPLVVLHIAE
jgi:hypothetical protein